MYRPAKIIIDLAAIQANCRLAQTLAPHSKTIAVIKADAYGHGAVAVANSLAPQVEMFAVSCLDEAMVLRQNGLSLPILLLEGCFDKTELKIVVDKQLDIVVHNSMQMQQVLNASLDEPVNVWLKIDTGMHRLGISPQDVAVCCAKLASSNNVKRVVLMTHFAHADDVEGAYTSEQMNQFETCIQTSTLNSMQNIEASMANSAGLLAWPQSRLDWNRPGIMLYGLSPFAEPLEISKELIPAMTFESQVIALRDVSVGESVGYGCSWIAKRPSVIATVAVGYGDGYPRSARLGTPVLINDQRVPLAGRVSMDLISVDVTDLANVAIGDTAQLWGKQLSANEVASWADTIGYELVTRMPRRITRQYSD